MGRGNRSRRCSTNRCCPNQQAIPAVDLLLEELASRNLPLLGTDYCVPAYTNTFEILPDVQGAIAKKTSLCNYTPLVIRLGNDRGRCRGPGRVTQQVGVVSTIQRRREHFAFTGTRSGRMCRRHDIPRWSQFSVAKEELFQVSIRQTLSGHLGGDWTTLCPQDTPANARVIRTVENNSIGDDKSA